MATNENLPEILDPKARANLDLILTRVSTMEDRERAAALSIWFEAQVLAWIRRDETAEAGPDSPNYFLEQRTAAELVMMAQIVTGVLIQIDEAGGGAGHQSDQFRLVQASGVLIREELVSRIERAADPELEF
jgi:hypothetical protein